MSNSPTPTEQVQSLYAAFGRGEIGTILDALRPDVEWRTNVDPALIGPGRIPLFGPFRGPQQVQEFFSGLGQDIEIHAFIPHAFLSATHEVAARVRMELTIRTTGKRLALESIHLWTFDDAGKVARFVEYSDTLAEAIGWDAVRPV